MESTKASHFPRITLKVNKRRKFTSPTLPRTTTIAEISTKGKRKIISTVQAILTIKAIKKESLLLNTTSLLSMIKGRNCVKKTKHEGWSYDRKFTPLDQSLEDVLKYMLSKEMVKLPRLADPPVPMGKWKDQFCKFHRTVGHNTENCFVLKNIVQDLIDKNLLVEGEEEEEMDILNQPFPSHTTTMISEQPFLPHEHIKPCSVQDLQVQHQVSVLRQAGSNF